MWNLQREFESRDDQPYKYGYGTMMRGAYHYVDLATRILSLNAEHFPERQLRLEVSAFGAFPVDQHQRFSQPIARTFQDAGARVRRHLVKPPFLATPLVPGRRSGRLRGPGSRR